MPTSSTDRRNRGFTLIELLVVVVLIGLTTLLVMVNLAPDDREHVRREAERLSILIEQARDEALGSGASIALETSAGGYRFLRRDASRQWQAITEAPFMPHALATGVRLGPVELDGRPLAPGQPLVFSSIGTAPALRIGLGAGSTRLRVRADTPARVVIERE
jgi:general secretion pathway protein H